VAYQVTFEAIRRFLSVCWFPLAPRTSARAAFLSVSSLQLPAALELILILHDLDYAGLKLYYSNGLNQFLYTMCPNPNILPRPTKQE
jgi:hypothetical protein